MLVTNQQFTGILIFDQKLLPEDLRDLASCIREDGNDAAHSANLGKEDTEDLLDFTVALLEKIYTQPEKIKIALERRSNRRQKSSD